MPGNWARSPQLAADSSLECSSTNRGPGWSVLCSSHLSSFQDPPVTARASVSPAQTPTLSGMLLRLEKGEPRTQEADTATNSKNQSMLLSKTELNSLKRKMPPPQRTTSPPSFCLLCVHSNIALCCQLPGSPDAPAEGRDVLPSLHF
ncbi:hypothetical protein P7K49_037900 [Saguinus oedipus]|uniref:Uncharacterized protein n=1 Tax=Saguinus oedipus TaxID=9490 RepID=A0ABQ9TJG9_SAGOE|nr:hypothetical protein P7K49_037900 [Saguinus oedipus]